MSQTVPFNKIEIFPSTKTQTMNKLITENSITRLINRLLDVEGYVISSEFPADVSSAIMSSNDNEYIPITGEITSKDLEFNIRGYYFNLGQYSEVLTDDSITKPSSEGGRLMASIYVTKDTNYPELYGQEIKEGRSINEPSGATSETVIEFPEGCTSANVSNIRVFDTDGNQLTIGNLFIDDSRKLKSGNTESSTYVTWVDENESGESGSGYEISIVKYVFTSSTESLYLTVTSGANDTPIVTDPPAGDYNRYDLVLLQKTSDGYGIPISSLHKFDTISVATIDGGVVTYEDEAIVL